MFSDLKISRAESEKGRPVAALTSIDAGLAAPDPEEDLTVHFVVTFKKTEKLRTIGLTIARMNKSLLVVAVPEEGLAWKWNEKANAYWRIEKDDRIVMVRTLDPDR